MFDGGVHRCSEGESTALARASNVDRRLELGRTRHVLSEAVSASPIPAAGEVRTQLQDSVPEARYLTSATALDIVNAASARELVDRALERSS